MKSKINKVWANIKFCKNKMDGLSSKYYLCWKSLSLIQILYNYLFGSFNISYSRLPARLWSKNASTL